jgi:hypothetical protein
VPVITVKFPTDEEEDLQRRFTVNTVSGAGILGVTATRTVSRVRSRSAQPGTLVLRIVPTRRGRWLLEQRGSLSLTVSVVYRPYVGQAVARTKRLRLVLNLRRRNGH